MKEKKKICFQVLDAYSLFNPATHYPFGGAEFRAYTFMHELHKLSFNVSAIVRNYGQGKEFFDGIRVFPHPYHTTLHKRDLLERIASFKWNAAAYEKHLKQNVYEEVNADVYCAFEITSATLILSRFCKEKKRKFFLFIASNGELAAAGTGGPDIMHDKREIASEVIGAADKIFVQNAAQMHDLRSHYRKEGILIRNPLSLTDTPPSEKKYDLVWVGKSNTVKRPEIFVQLAKALPQFRCCMILNVSDQNIHDGVLRQKPANLDIIEHLPLSETERVISGSRALVSTSLIEGFPNTFLQAGKFHVPILSMVIDPDGLLSKSECGLLTGDNINSLAEAAKQLLSNTVQQREMAGKMYQYVSENHEAGRVTKLLAAQLAS